MSRRARVMGLGDEGFGLLETLAGLVVFVILLVVGMRAYRAVVANHSEASEVKALTDAVATTAERLSGFTMAVLAGPGSPHVTWSAPAEVGNGTYHYRYRIIPRPLVGGKQDTTVVGLEVEAGDLEGGKFVPARAFATLIPPNLSAKGALGAVSTKAERDAERAFHEGLVARIDDLTERVVPENQQRLNSFSCYDKGQCCGFMRKYFLNPGIVPEDGLEEKCHYRCALGGDVALAEWRASCGFDLCTLAPWKTKQDCCAAIADGSCKPGSVCARVCVECVGEDGSTCASGTCDGAWFNDLFDCKNGSFCDGTPLPDGVVPGWGNVKLMCKSQACSSLPTECEYKLNTCCRSYWGTLNLGGVPDPKLAICEKISTRAECCNYETRAGYFNFYCGTDGKMIAAQSHFDNRWYCDFGTGPRWDIECSHTQGCPSTFKPPGAPSGGSCPAWTGPYLEHPGVDPRTGLEPPPAPPSTVVDKPGSGGGMPILPPILPPGGGKGDDRKGSKRDGDGDERRGGRE